MVLLLVMINVLDRNSVESSNSLLAHHSIISHHLSYSFLGFRIESKILSKLKRTAEFNKKEKKAI